MTFAHSCHQEQIPEKKKRSNNARRHVPLRWFPLASPLPMPAMPATMPRKSPCCSDCVSADGTEVDVVTLDDISTPNVKRLYNQHDINRGGLTNQEST